MSGQITDELREWAYNVVVWNGNNCARLVAIADRIDAEYEKVLGCKVARAISVGEDGTEFVSMPAKELSERYVELPKDMHDEYIHIGDVMAYEDNTKPMEVVALVPPAVFITDEGPRYADMCRHYKPPTTEDMLREFMYAILNQKPEFREENIAEYAKRLTLRAEVDG